MPIFKKISKFTIPKQRIRSSWGTASPEEAEGFQDRLDNLVGSLGLLGLQVSLKTTDGNIWNGASGTVDLPRKIPLTTEHVMRIASTTKMFTSVVILHLVETGALSDTDTLARWLPSFPRADKITIRMLLSHTGGIENPPFTTRVKLRFLFSKRCFTLDELIATAADTPPYDEPGNAYRYSNTNHHLLGFIAQKVTGTPIADLYDAVIFRKLGLTRTALLPDRAPPPSLITGFDNLYTPSLRMLRVTPDNLMLASHGNTAGGMVSTAKELLTFITGLFSGRLLGNDTVRRMMEMRACNDPDYCFTGNGTGLFRIQIGTVEYVGHPGFFVGFQALALYNPLKKTAVAAVGNLSDSRIFDVVQRFEDIIG